MNHLNGLDEYETECRQAQEDELSSRNALGSLILAVALVSAIVWVVLS